MTKQEAVCVMSKYIDGCNIDLDVAEADLKIPAGTVTYSDITSAGLKRCEGCSCWYKGAGAVCDDCLGILKASTYS